MFMGGSTSLRALTEPKIWGPLPFTLLNVINPHPLFKLDNFINNNNHQDTTKNKQ